jgi:UDP-N-acetylglucosamine 1-carboxyvinyltransferase
MHKFVVNGGNPLTGEFVLAGAKNVALKTCVCALLTDEPLTISNIPIIDDVRLMGDLLIGLGADSEINGHSIRMRFTRLKTSTVPLSLGARLRTSSLILGPLLARFGEALIPNPGGCRIGARPIDRHIEGLTRMGAEIHYDSNDGFFHAYAKKLHGAEFTFTKNTHTGTEALLLAAVLAEGTTVLHNAAREVEINDLINLLVAMGADIQRPNPRDIVIRGVSKLHGAEYEIMSDRNEEVTLAIAAAITGGKITVRRSFRSSLDAFTDLYRRAGGIIEEIDGQTTVYMSSGKINPTDVVTVPHPGFMTDWQAPWAVFMTQAKGVSTVHETVFENRFTYVSELQKMGGRIEYYQPEVPDPASYYNFNWEDRQEDSGQAIRITGPTKLHNAVLSMNDLRAGASLLIAALTAEGESTIYGVEQIDRGYERIDERLAPLGAHIQRIEEE